VLAVIGAYNTMCSQCKDGRYEGVIRRNYFWLQISPTSVGFFFALKVIAMCLLVKPRIIGNNARVRYARLSPIMFD
jgi:hypothetical protein